MTGAGAMGSSPNRLAPPSGRGPRIGLLVDVLGSDYNETIVSELIGAAHEHGLGTVCIAGGKLSPSDLDAQRRSLFDLATPGSVDGLIVLSLGGRVGPEQVSVFCRRYHPLPLCGLGVPLTDHASVLVDNETGLRQAILHLIRIHGRRRLAFIAGPQFNVEARLRFDVYRAVLAENDIPFDPHLVAPGSFEYDSAVRAVQLLLDGRRVRFEGVVCANDASATAAIDELQRRHIAVPREVAVIGFDDLRMSRYLEPALTTIRQPVREQARCAVQTLLALMGGDPARPHTVLPTELVIRESCGCPAYVQSSISPAPRPPGENEGADFERMRREQTEASAAMHAIGVVGAPSSTWPERLYAEFVADLQHPRSSFLREFAQLAHAVARAEGDPGALHKVTPILAATAQRHLRGGTLRRADDLLHAAQVKLNGIVGAIPVRRLHVARDQMWALLSNNEVLARATDHAGLGPTLSTRLAAHSISAVYICKYESDGGARLIAGCSSSGSLPLPEGGEGLPAATLLADLVKLEEQADFVVNPLDWAKDTRGYAVFVGWTGRPHVYEALAAQIGSTLGKIRLLERLVAEAREREIAEAERLEGELRIAAEIQAGVLPRTLQVEGLAVAAAMHPTAEVGGDYYDVVPTDRGCWIGIGDVTGHGLPAGLTMLMVQAVVRGVARWSPDALPSELCSIVNGVIHENLRHRMDRDDYVTLTLIRYDGRGRLIYAGAHEPILVCRASDGRVQIFETPGIWIGIMPDISHMTPDSEVELGPGDLMVLHTDGVTEAMNAQGEMFGIERLANCIALARERTVQEIRDALLGAVKKWAPLLRDDICVVIARRPN